MPYGKLRIPYVTISLVPYAIFCIFFIGMSYVTIIGVVRRFGHLGLFRPVLRGFLIPQVLPVAADYHEISDSEILDVLNY